MWWLWLIIPGELLIGFTAWTILVTGGKPLPTRWYDGM